MNQTVRKPFTLDRIVRIIIGVLILVVAGMLVNRLSQVLLPFLLAWLLAYLMYPLMHFFQYTLRLRNRILAIAVTLLTVFGVLFLMAYLLVPPVIEETKKAVDIVNRMIADNTLGVEVPPALLSTVQGFLNGIDTSTFSFDNLEGLLKAVLPHIWTVFTKAGSVVINVVLSFMVLLYLIFILKDYETISTNWIELIPKHYRPFILQVGDDLKEGMNKYFRGQALIAFIVGILFAIGFSIINLPMGIIFGLTAGAMNMVPYLQTVAILPGIMLAAIKAAEYDQNFFWVAVSVLAVFAIVQVIEEVLLTPNIMGRATGLNPAIILLSLSIWGALLGMVGMILALPVTTLMISYYRRFVIKGGMIEKLVLDPDTPWEYDQETTKKRPPGEEAGSNDESTLDA
ncbi:MAG: AI-2E family transporter [Bacteroidales bacterium]|nr:AI-2E family transporter [Bacteroidales bacterium]